MRILFVIVSIVVLFAFNNCDQQVAQESATLQSNETPGPYCGNVAETLRDPKTIDQVTQLINALPKPLEINCFLGALKRPLKVFAVDNATSAQPSGGVNSPRIFIISNYLTMSVVPVGIGKDVLEMGLLTSQTSSVKAELPFPVNANLVGYEPYSHILTGGGTNCAICHNSETNYPQITTGVAYTSRIIKPDPFKRVPQSYLKNQASNCNFVTDAFRCEMLKRIYVDGQARDVNFPDGPI